MDGYEQFAEIYSISDLHLTVGANVDRAAVALLTRTVDALATRARARSDGRAALVINGDLVDFLDIEPSAYFDPLGAPDKLDRVLRANAELWAALARFSAVGTVALTLGNHDVELALPSCRAMLRGAIPGALALAFDGAGYRCRLGDTTALFLHGNNEDPWNFVDHERLGRIAAAVNAGAPHEPWEPNEGTRLVIELLNEQKRQHPFIEYVKPETGWLFELIAKLGFGGLARQYAELAPRQVAASARYRARGWSAQAAYLGEPAPRSAAAQPAPRRDGDALLLEANRRHRAGRQVLAAPDPDAGASTLGIRDVFRTQRAPDAEIRDHILSSLVGDTTFVPSQGDAIYQALGPKLGREIGWVVCGHTHLRRALQDGERRAYFNSGTWMRLLDLYAATAAEGQLARVLAALDATTRAELDAITWRKDGVPHPLVLREPTVVLLRRTDDGGEGWLANAAAPALDPVPGSLLKVTR